MLQQMAKDKYSIETLRELNVSYDREHWLTQDDVDMANNYVQLIERIRSEITPQVVTEWYMSPSMEIITDMP